MARKLYPIGIQTFERIRKEDMFYVDKTEYIVSIQPLFWRFEQ